MDCMTEATLPRRKPFNHCHHEVHSSGSHLPRPVSGSRQESEARAVMFAHVQDVMYGPVTLAWETQKHR